MLRLGRVSTTSQTLLLRRKAQTAREEVAEGQCPPQQTRSGLLLESHAKWR